MIRAVVFGLLLLPCVAWGQFQGQAEAVRGQTEYRIDVAAEQTDGASAFTRQAVQKILVEEMQRAGLKVAPPSKRESPCVILVTNVSNAAPTVFVCVAELQVGHMLKLPNGKAVPAAYWEESQIITGPMETTDSLRAAVRTMVLGLADDIAP